MEYINNQYSLVNLPKSRKVPLLDWLIFAYDVGQYQFFEITCVLTRGQFHNKGTPGLKNRSVK